MSPNRYKWSVADKSAAIVAIAAAALFVLKKSYLDLVRAPLQPLADLGVVAEGAIASLVAGSIFFLVVNRFYEIRERSVIEPWISKKTSYVVGQFDAMVAEIAKASAMPLTHESTEQDFKAALGKIIISSNAPLMNYAMQHVGWPVYFKHQLDRSRRAIASLIDRVRFLTADEVKAISDIEDHHLFFLVDTLASAPLNPTMTLGNTASSFKSFADALRPLRKIP